MTLSNGNSKGITAIGDDGLGQQPWWVEQWMEPVSYTHLTLPTMIGV